MGETSNIAEIPQKLTRDIFRHFLWGVHPKRDENFKCNNPAHLSDGKKPAPKKTHPGDAVFYYADPYLGKTVYLHADLKSYGKKSINETKIRGALRSLCMTVECAQGSSEWRSTYSVLDDEAHEVRGLLLVHNHDLQFQEEFSKLLGKIDLAALPLPAEAVIHYLGPEDIQRLFSIAHDICALIYDGWLSSEYGFFYPDLVMVHRRGIGLAQAATIESLTGPYLIIRNEGASNAGSGYVIYYNRPVNSADELEYFLDCLSRYQMLVAGETIKIRVTSQDGAQNIKSIFDSAKQRYARVWGYDPARIQVLQKIEIERITAFTSSYNPGDMGWDE